MKTLGNRIVQIVVLAALCECLRWGNLVAEMTLVAPETKQFLTKNNDTFPYTLRASVHEIHSTSPTETSAASSLLPDHENIIKPSAPTLPPLNSKSTYAMANASHETIGEAPLYKDLSCSIEWSKYSCFHQEKYKLAEASYQLALGPWQHYVSQANASSFLKFINSKRKLVLVGDSTMRQVFIALGCQFGLMDMVEDYYVNWGNNFVCHKAPNCITKGVHSGFTRGRIFLKEGLQIYYLQGPMGNPREGRLVERWRQEWINKRQMTFDFEESGSNASTSLHRKDILVYNIGLHLDGKRHEYYQALQGLGQAIITNSTTTRKGPNLVYMTTMTQHFPTPMGGYKESLRIPNRPDVYQCNNSVPYNARRKIEEERLKLKLHIDHFFHPEDEAYGSHHIGGNDCTHYCMPGVPDLTAMRLIRQLARDIPFTNNFETN